MDLIAKQYNKLSTNVNNKLMLNHNMVVIWRNSKTGLYLNSSLGRLQLTPHTGQLLQHLAYRKILADRVLPTRTRTNNNTFHPNKVSKEEEQILEADITDMAIRQEWRM
jgi:hypothetical protein